MWNSDDINKFPFNFECAYQFGATYQLTVKYQCKQFVQTTKSTISMESFKELKFRLHRFGIVHADSSAKEWRLSIIKNCVVLCSFVSFFVSTGWFRLFAAQSIDEITMSSFLALVALLHTVWYSALIWQRHQYTAIFNEIDVKIQQSEYNFNGIFL